jgi:hypothetical protein
MITVSHGAGLQSQESAQRFLEPRYGQAMAETPDTVIKKGCCPNTTGISLPAREYLPGDGIHNFDFRSTMRQMGRGFMAHRRRNRAMLPA